MPDDAGWCSHSGLRAQTVERMAGCEAWLGSLILRLEQELDTYQEQTSKLLSADLLRLIVHSCSIGLVGGAVAGSVARGARTPLHLPERHG
jgi:hypothetical protein